MSTAKPPLDQSILIVDDDPGAQEAFEHMLATEGYGIRVASDAASALSEVARTPPAAVLLDLHLGSTDGVEVLRRLRGMADRCHIPVAVVTGDYMVEERIMRELHDLGARVYFKPLWQEDVVRIVRDLLPDS